MEMLARVISLRGLALAVPLAALALLLARLYARRGAKPGKTPGQCPGYTVPGRTAAECRGLLLKPEAADMFAYTLQDAPGGGCHLHFTLHNPTGQMLDTLFLLAFIGEAPAAFTLTFVREAFGMREPVIGEALLDTFFAEKLGARRTPPPIGG